MVHTKMHGVISKDRNGLAMILIAIGFAVMATIGMILPTQASHGTLLDSFTQAELDTDWEADRQFPSDGVTSVSEFGRDDVARIGIDSEETADGTFQRTEGIKTVIAAGDNFGDEVHVDLFVDPDWQDTAVRAGFWVVGDDGGNRDQFFGIIEFVNNEPCPEEDCSNQSNITDHEGFRIWDSTIGWTQNLDTEFEYGEWVTLGIALDADAGLYTYYINGEEVGTAAGGNSFIRELFLNSYNYGEDDFPTLNEDSYAAHWHVGLLVATSKDDCKNGGWETFGFRNQGQCIRFVNTGQDSR